MAFLGVKLNDKDQKILEEKAARSGKTLSDYIRDLIRNDQEKDRIGEILAEIATLHSREIAALREEVKALAGRTEPGNADPRNSELQDIRRLVGELDKRSAEQHRIITLLGQASPFVSRQLGQQQ